MFCYIRRVHLQALQRTVREAFRQEVQHLRLKLHLRVIRVLVFIVTADEVVARFLSFAVLALPDSGVLPSTTVVSSPDCILR